MTGGEHVSWPLVQFSVIGEAWQLYKRHWVVWSLTQFVAIVGYLFANGMLYAILGDHQTELGQGLVGITCLLVAGFFGGGMVRMAIKQIEGRVPRLEDVFSVTDVWFDLLLCTFLYTVAALIGTGLCVIPGFIVGGLFMLSIPLVVEARLPATGAMIQSWNALKSQWLTATCFHLVLTVILYSGFGLCGVGILVTGPIYSISLAILYHNFFPASGLTAWKKHAEPFPEV
jgi:hypothetical protein